MKNLKGNLIRFLAKSGTCILFPTKIEYKKCLIYYLNQNNVITGSFSNYFFRKLKH
jgi:hypothetical protein